MAGGHLLFDSAQKVSKKASILKALTLGWGWGLCETEIQPILRVVATFILNAMRNGEGAA